MSATLKKTLEQKFNYDTSDVPAYTDEQSAEYIADLIQSSEFLSRLMLETDVKGSKTIKLLSGDMSLQAKVGCTPNPDGTISFPNRDIASKLLYMGIELCNEDLNGKYTQLLNKAGVANQNDDIVLSEILLGYLGRIVRKKIQNITFLGDTQSVNDDLLHFDGFVKLIENDPDVNVVYSTETEWTIDNGYALAKSVYDAIPQVVFDDGLNYVLLTGRQEARAILDNVWKDKDFSAKVEFTETDDGGIMFTLPTTNITVMTVPELNGTGNMYGWPFDYAFAATDLESDIDLSQKYHEYDDKLKVETSFRWGVQFIQPQYWVRLRLTATS